MNSSIKGITLGLGLIFVIVVLRYLITRRLSEKNSLFWLSGALAILVLGACPEAVDSLARRVGVAYPPTLLFLLSTLVMLVILLHHSVELSTQQAKLRELTQQLAVVQHRLELIAGLGRTGPTEPEKPGRGV